MAATHPASICKHFGYAFPAWVDAVAIDLVCGLMNAFNLIDGDGWHRIALITAAVSVFRWSFAAHLAMC